MHHVLGVSSGAVSVTVLLPVAASHSYEDHLRRACEEGVVGVHLMEVQAETAEVYERQVPMVRSVTNHPSSLLLFDHPRSIDRS